METSAPTQAQETAPAGAEEVDVFALEVGDCLTDYRATEGVVSVPTMPCSEPHSGEIYAVVPLPEGDGNYPGVEAISAQAEEKCIAEFEGFVGLSYEESVLEFICDRHLKRLSGTPATGKSSARSTTRPA